MRHCGISATVNLQISVLSAVLVEQTTWDPAHLHWSFTFVCVCVEGDSSAEVFCLRMSYFIFWLPIIQCGQFLVGRCVCVDVKTWICIVARIYESSENPRCSSVPREISRAHCQQRPGGILWTLIKRSKRGSTFNTGKLKRDKRKAQLIK